MEKLIEIFDVCIDAEIIPKKDLYMKGFREFLEEGTRMGKTVVIAHYSEEYLDCLKLKMQRLGLENIEFTTMYPHARMYVGRNYFPFQEWRSK